MLPPSLRRFLWALPTLLSIIAVLYLVVSIFALQGVATAERNPQEAHPRDYGLPAEDVAFSPRGGNLKLAGWYLQSEPRESELRESEAHAPHLILVHGLNSVRSGDGAVALAARLVAQGYSVLLFDLRGHGASESGRLSGGYYEREDVWGAYDYLLENRSAAVGKIGLVGFSMGAGTAILAAAAEPGIAAVVADSPYAKATQLLAQEISLRTPLPRWLTPIFVPAVSMMADVFYDIDIGALAPEDAVTDLAYPVLVIHGDADRRIPHSHGRRVADAGRPGSALWRVAGAKHVAAFENNPDEYEERVAEYLDSRLR